MTRKVFFSVRTITLVVVLFLFVPCFVEALSAQDLPALFRQTPSPVSAQDSHRPAGDNINVEVDFSLIRPSKSAKAALQALLPDRTVVLLKKKIETRGPDNYTWVGKVKGHNLSTVVITVVNGVMHGHVAFEGGAYTIGPYGAGYLIKKVDRAERVPFNDDARVPKIKKKHRKAASPAYLDQENGSRIDVLVLYTQAMLAKYGSGLASKIQSFADLANTAYENSNINTRIALVGTELYDDPNVDETVNCGLINPYCIDNALSYITCGTADSGACMNNDSPSPPVQISALREKYKADLVSLMRVYQPWGATCGLAWVMQEVDSTFADFAFSVVEVHPDNCDEITFAHELGHNMGCAHDRDNANTNGAYSYSYGYDRQYSNGTGIFGTVMSYDTPTITYFSSPLVKWPDPQTGPYLIGQPEGHKDANGNDDSADNARTINNTRVTLANLRVAGTHTVTVSPTTHGSLSPSKVVLAHGEYQTFTITPAEGYHLKGLTDNGLDVTGLVSGNSYTIQVIEEHTLEAVFALEVSPEAVISISPASGSFGYENVGISSVEKTFTIQNTGTAGLIIDSISVTGSDAAMFTVSSGTCSPLSLTLPAGGTCGLAVTFLPASAGPKTAALRITSNASASPTLELPLSGIGGYYLEVAKGGTGTGMVTSSPAGIACGPDCSEIYEQGSVVTLTPAADSGFVFTGWSGGGCSGTGQCSITINGTKVYVTATFMTTHNISAAAGTGGNITPSGTTAVTHGYSQSFAITPEQGYHVKAILVDKVDVTGSLTPAGKVYTYTFTDLKAEHSIEAVFTIDLDPEGAVSVSPDSEDFGPVTLVSSSPSQHFTIRNTGTTDLIITSIGLTGGDAAMFSLSADTGCATFPARIGKGLTCGINIIFSPSSIGKKSTTLRVSSNASANPDFDVALNGMGTLPEYTLWSKAYGGGSDDSAGPIQQTKDGGYIVAGATSSFGKDGSDFWVLRLDSGGNIEWQKSYGGIGDDRANSIQQTADGGYIVAGASDSFGEGDTDFWVLKLDLIGNIVWQKTYGGAGNDDGPLVQQTTDGGYIVGGTTYSFGSGYDDFWLLSLDSEGIIRWEKTYGGNTFDRLSSLRQTLDGGYVAAGTTSSFADGGTDFWVLKLKADGNAEWQKTYGGAGNDDGPAVQQTYDGGYVLAGTTYSVSAGDGNIMVLKLGPYGNIVWQKTYGGSKDDYATIVRETLDSGYIVAGTTYSFGPGDGDIWLLKLDANGNIQWESTYDNNGNDNASALQQTLDGGYIVAGTSYPIDSTGPDKGDIRILKLDGQGNIKDCSTAVASNAIVTETAAVAGNANTKAEGMETAATLRQTEMSPVITAAGNTLLPSCHSDLPLSILKVTNTGSGVGRITSGPSGIDCGNDCAEAYNYGTEVILTAVANPGSAFVGWEGACKVNDDGTCTATTNAAGNVAATFIPVGDPFTISGTVMADRAPLAGVVVSLSGDKIKTATTDSKGKYLLTELPAGNYAVTPDMPGYSFEPASYSVKVENADVKVQKFMTYSVSGAVLTGGKSPLAGASVVLNNDSITKTVVTDTKGRYVFNGLALGVYTVTPKVSEYAFVPGTRSVTIHKANISSQNFVSYTLSGTIKTVGKKPLSGVEVLLEGNNMTKTAITDSKGKYNFTGLASGIYTITPTPGFGGYSFVPAGRPVKIGKTNVTGRNFTGKGAH